jgi:hypothetical protein
MHIFRDNGVDNTIAMKSIYFHLVLRGVSLTGGVELPTSFALIGRVLLCYEVTLDSSYSAGAFTRIPVLVLLSYALAKLFLESC